MDKISSLRMEMKRRNIDCYMVTSSDPHGSEYVAPTFKAREYLTGFSGSAGTLVVTMTEAGLWTDGRYFTQAEAELQGSLVTLYRMGEPKVPTINEFLKKTMKQGQVFGFDGRMVSAQMGKVYVDELLPLGVKISYTEDLIATVWKERPALPRQAIWELSVDWSGQSTKERLKDVRTELKKQKKSPLIEAADGGKKSAGCVDKEALILNSLDDIMWLFNLRGSDIPFNPVALSYALVTEDKAVLFADKAAVSDELRQSLAAASVTVEEYDDFYEWLDRLILPSDTAVTLDGERCNYTIYQSLHMKAKLRLTISPPRRMKAIKNETELAHLSHAYKTDSAVLIRFLKWLSEQEETVNERGVAAKLDEIRLAALDCYDLSFNTLAAYGANAAMMHYSPSPLSDVKLKKEGFFLIDSGGQYYGGTTDITRTVVMGAISDDMRRHFTATLKGLLSLSNTIFLHGATGRNLDAIARKPLWEIGSDYKCGTGHGLGYMLSVHEGPQGFWMKERPQMPEAVLEAGMLLSIEPGVYKPGEYGIRLENIVVVKDVFENADGRFLTFTPLTFVPIDLAGVEVTLLSPTEKEQLNDYHRQVREEVKAYLNEAEMEWLINATSEI
ncbi:MAG: aminopeptidase P family protein [Lachnospiraceae bacterium]|nr:aminopeptidase P family protein [Lachnospiraceae bacterium]